MFDVFLSDYVHSCFFVVILFFVFQPDFSCTPLNSEAEVGNWLKFYEMDPTLVCLGELVSHDPVSSTKTCLDFSPYLLQMGSEVLELCRLKMFVGQFN